MIAMKKLRTTNSYFKKLDSVFIQEVVHRNIFVFDNHYKLHNYITKFYSIEINSTRIEAMATGKRVNPREISSCTGEGKGVYLAFLRI